MTKLTGGIFFVSPIEFLFQCLPTTRTAVERDPRLALRIDVRSYTGSAGEPTFKDPKPIMDDPAVRTWVRALRGDNDAVQLICHSSFSDAATKALLRDAERRAMQPTRKPSRNGSTIQAGMIPRERNPPQHAKSNSGQTRNVKERDTSKKAKELTPKEKALAEYRASWGQKRSLKMKWYLIPDDQRELLDKIGPSPNRAMSPDLGPPEPMSPELGPREDVDNDDEDVDELKIAWSSSPVPHREDAGKDKFAFATPRPPSQPVILVPNSDPSSRATNSQSQSQSIAQGSQSQSIAASSQQSQSSRRDLTAPNGSKEQQQQQPSSAAPSHVSDTVLHSSARKPPADGDGSLTQSTSQSASQPGPQDAPQPPAEGDQSLTQSTSQSQSQPLPEEARKREPVVEAVAEQPDQQSHTAEASPAAMDVDLPAPPADEQLDEDDARTYGMLVASGDRGTGQTRKRARADESSIPPAAKRTRRTNESSDGDSKPTTMHESPAPASQGAAARARKTVTRNGHPKRARADDAKASPGTARARPGPVGPVGTELEPADIAREPVAPDIARHTGMPVKEESPSPVHRQKRSPEVQRPVADEREQDGLQSTDITLQGVMDILFRLGQARQREAKASRL
ncbi:hypothetical protein AURDEDRAFT_120123 [Auricularia subglabra TFB-10046 SS5]|nr:hypothetical protein AURDEDRAFT_120123 [Auricularia subglabra TFB-10046 SS5]